MSWPRSIAFSAPGNGAPSPAHRAAVFGLLGLFLVLCLTSIRGKSFTYDEPQHFRYGLQLLLEHRAERFDDSKMPISMLNALPRAMALASQRVLGLEAPPAWLFDMCAGRVMTALTALLLGLCVYRWSRELYGDQAALLSLLLFALSPNLIAHAGLITTDVYAATFITLSCYAFWRFLCAPSWKSALVSGLALGLAQLAKYTAVFLAPIFALILVTQVLASMFQKGIVETGAHLLRSLPKILGWTVIHLLAVVMLLNMGFLGDRFSTPLGDYAFRSTLFQGLRKLPVLANLPLPLPYPFLEGLDMVKHVDGHLRNPIYLHGELRSNGELFPGYFNFVALYKVPLPTLALVLLASLSALCSQDGKKFRAEEQFLLIPFLFFWCYFNFLFHTQIGIRFMLVMLPLAFVFCGRLLAAHHAPPWRRPALSLLIAWLLLSNLSYFPHYIAYFNELTLDRKFAYLRLADSNIDYGQDDFLVESFRRSHPEAIFQPKGPVAGTIVVSVNMLIGIFPHGQNEWLRDNFRPQGHIGYSHLIFEISPTELEKIDPKNIEYFHGPDSETFRRDHDYFIVNRWRAASLAAVHEYGQSRLHLEQLQRFLPDDREVQVELARICELLQDTAVAIHHRSRAEQLRQCSLRYEQALKDIQVGEYRTALSSLDGILPIDPQYRLSLFHRGLTLQLMNRHEESVADYHGALLRDPGYFQTLFNLGYAYMTIHRHDLAIPLFERVLRTRPDYQAAELHLKHCRQEQHQGLGKK